MSLWGSSNTANQAPKHSVLINKAANGQSQFQNTSIGTYGITVGTSPKTHSGWVLRKQGTGSVVSLSITTAGTGYSNTTHTVNVSGGTVNATANVVTNGSGAITGFINLVGGAGFTGTPTVAIVGAGGSAGVVTAILGGRANRMNDEVLVALGSMSS